MDKQKGRGRFVFLCLAPAVILFTVFMVIPTINVFRMSLYKWGGYSANQEFVGLDNFKKLFADPKFYQSFQNTILLIVIVTIIPNILSVVVISAIFSAIYDPNNGMLNSLIALFREPGEVPTLWLGNQQLVIYSIAIALVWQAIGYYMVMYMASMASIPESIYESVNLDGAGRVKTFFSITIPLVWTNIRTTLTFFIISTINLSFLFVKAMTSGGPDGASEVILSYMYKQAYTNSSYGYGMAIGAVVFIFSFALSAIVNKVTKREPLEF